MRLALVLLVVLLSLLGGCHSASQWSYSSRGYTHNLHGFGETTHEYNQNPIDFTPRSVQSGDDGHRLVLQSSEAAVIVIGESSRNPHWYSSDDPNVEIWLLTAADAEMPEVHLRDRANAFAKLPADERARRTDAVRMTGEISLIPSEMGAERYQYITLNLTSDRPMPPDLMWLRGCEQRLAIPNRYTEQQQEELRVRYRRWREVPFPPRPAFISAQIQGDYFFTGW